MITNKTGDQILQIVRNGGSVVVDAGKLSADDILQIARNLTEGSFVRVGNSDRLTFEQMLQIARFGRVVFE